jgi:hypothetical protein
LGWAAKFESMLKEDYDKAFAKKAVEASKTRGKLT